MQRTVVTYRTEHSTIGALIIRTGFGGARYTIIIMLDYYCYYYYYY